MTDQEIFDVVARHLLAQGGQALAEAGCVYRAPDGRRCAVGCLVPDDVYAPGMEGLSVSQLVEEWPDLDWMAPHVDLLETLQALHDDHPPADWPTRLRLVAGDYRLVMEGVA